MQEVHSTDANYINPAQPNLLKLYVNSFAAGHSASDMYLVGQLNGLPMFVLNMSFTTAKSLRDTLDELVATFQEKAGFDIHSIDEISEKFISPSAPKEIE